MDMVILIPAMACLLALTTGSARKALVNVYLPVVLLLPQFFLLRFAHLPPLTFADAAILPLGLAMLVADVRRWRPAWMDLWVLLFAGMAAMSGGVAAAVANGGADFFKSVVSIVLPYMAGKLLIEQDGAEGQPVRRRLVRRMVVLLAVVAGISVFDFLTGKSSWQIAFKHVFPDQPSAWPAQAHWGFGPIAGPFAWDVLAGMVFLMGLSYCLWLRIFAPEWGKQKIVDGLPFTERGLVLVALLGGLLMTESQGSWVGVGLALLLVLLVRTMPLGRAALVFVVLVAALAGVAYQLGQQFMDPAPFSASTEGQSDHAGTVVAASVFGATAGTSEFGWFLPGHLLISGDESIEDELLAWDGQRRVAGLALFLLILVGTGGRLLRMGGRPFREEDRGLLLAHGAVLLGLGAAIAIGYQGEEASLLFFLVVGWVHGMNPAGAKLRGADEFMGPFQFQRVLT
jgi:hypothetical protein